MNFFEGGIPFVKAAACGNDFLLIDTAAISSEANLIQLSQRLCDRHNGIGADGVEWMSPDESADVAIQLINADGSEAEISGNGTRCVAAYMSASQGKEKISIRTGAGLKTCILTGRAESETESEFEFEAEMGHAAVEDALALHVNNETIHGIPVSMGNPHYVQFVSDFPADWQARAAAIQKNPHFKQGVNIEMVIVDGKHDVRVRFFERGVGETQSSGTGSCAAAAAAIAAGKAQSPVRVHAPGGKQIVRQQNGLIFLRGAASLICQGVFYIR